MQFFAVIIQRRSAQLKFEGRGEGPSWNTIGISAGRETEIRSVWPRRALAGCPNATPLLITDGMCTKSARKSPENIGDDLQTLISRRCLKRRGGVWMFVPFKSHICFAEGTGRAKTARIHPDSRVYILSEGASLPYHRIPHTRARSSPRGLAESNASYSQSCQSCITWYDRRFINRPE